MGPGTQGCALRAYPGLSSCRPFGALRFGEATNFDGDDPGEIGCAISRGEAGIGDDVGIVSTGRWSESIALFLQAA